MNVIAMNVIDLDDSGVMIKKVLKLQCNETAYFWQGQYPPGGCDRPGELLK
ncbi:hypothetical protein J5X98_26040 [Leptothermofonsia sichuanensis E412]|uniref:hypothetical protein n=1 Tax=Leptothermofonsia sichuanensis TaxID=2917832 RepID=UPI001CA78AD6|nr:hypothetical protein [Leptothermofonsia sichuanensis]QZZ20648.1 hypothetical protein J5X98_26040 [Leptothermofonsia sichuanensis E412]